jgi:hypothetical protein
MRQPRDMIGITKHVREYSRHACYLRCLGTDKSDHIAAQSETQSVRNAVCTCQYVCLVMPS